MAFCAQHLTTSVPMFELPDSIASAVMWSTKGNLHDQLSIHSWQTSESNWLKKLTLIQSIPQMFIPTIQDTQRNLIQKHLTATGRGKPRVLQTFRWHFLFQLLPWRRRPRPFLRTGCGRLICSQSGSSLGEDQATKGWSLTWIQRESPIPGCHFQVTCHVISMDSSKKQVESYKQAWHLLNVSIDRTCVFVFGWKSGTFGETFGLPDRSQTSQQFFTFEADTDLKRLRFDWRFHPKCSQSLINIL